MAAKKNASSHKSAPAKETAAVVKTSDRVTVAHGPYLIVAGRRNDECAAIGYLGNKRITQTTAESVDAALAAAKAALDERVSDLRAGRVDDVPSESEFQEAFGALYPKMSSRMKAVLAAHCRLPGAATTLADLARRFDVSETSIKQDYGKLARGVAGLLDFAPVDREVERKLLPLLSLATVTVPDSDGRPVLQLRPELVGALRAMHQVDA